MARSTGRPPKKPTPISSNVAVEEPPPDIQADIPPSFQPPAANEFTKDARPVYEEAKPAAPPKTPTFYQTINKISKADWGPRANIYLYRVEPVIDRTRSGDSKFINTYAEPVNEDRIMADYGSGKYKLLLNFRKAGADTGDLLDSVYMDILNMKYPPKIPLGEWVDDPRNKKWAWAKEANGIPTAASVAPAATGVETLVDVMRVTGDMRRELREEMREATPAAPAVALPPDPFDTAKKIMDMRGNDPMIAALMQRLEAADRAAEKARDREFELMKELRQTAAAPATPAKSFTDQLLDIAALGDKLEPIKKLFGFGSSNGDAPVGRVARTTAYDVVRDIASSPFGANLGQGLGMLLSNLAQSGAQAQQNGAPRPAMPTMPPVLNAQQSNGTIPPKETTEQQVQRIGQLITQPMLYEFFLKDEGGETFAERMFDMWPEDYIFMRNLGPDNILARYRQFAPAWAVIAPKEPAFHVFIQEFCNWDPNEDEGPTPPADGDAGTVDLDSEAGA